jgi:PKD repeat protein
MSFQSKANEVTVKGYIKFANGAYAPNIQVKISVESPCVVEHYVTTNSDGFYIDKVHCEGPITHVRISIKCEGQVITVLKEPSPNYVIEANLTLCISPAICIARFTATQLEPIENQKFPVKFNSNNSETSAPGQIIQRIWNFGDGHIMTEGSIDPTHNYEKAGLYNVCLTIKTDKGCTNTKCISVEVKSRCHADFRFEPTNAGMKFNGSISVSNPNDPIIGWNWNFGDGSAIVKGNADPVHLFPHAGTYNVCLVVWTAEGCENKVCKQVVVAERVPECVAKFTATQVAPIENQKFPVRFNSSSSETSSGDKIIQRTWNFGDGVIINEGTIDPIHNYEKPGFYNVCLTIKTDKGCVNKKCITIEVKSRCHADFRFEHTIAGVKFNSSISTSSPNDPIVGRSWNFGDGTPVIKGNIDPLHIFPHAGTFNVCLVVWTAGGCETRECKQVVVPERTVECRARYSFERVAPKKFRFNSSLSTVAAGDEIVERQWDFRDGTDVVTTHDISILHEFTKPGIYEVCLKIKTAKGCESRYCFAIRVGDGEEHQGEGSIKIISLYPTPVHRELKALVYSRSNHILATISIVDVYGQVKWTKQVWLAQGNNPFEIPTGALLPGPYFFRVVTGFGVQSRLIYKI